MLEGKIRKDPFSMIHYCKITLWAVTWKWAIVGMLTDTEILHLLTLFTEKRDLVCELFWAQKTWVIKNGGENWKNFRIELTLVGKFIANRPLKTLKIRSKWHQVIIWWKILTILACNLLCSKSTIKVDTYYHRTQNRPT